MGKWTHRVFGIKTEEVRFDYRGFRGGHDPTIRQHIETVGLSFLTGYHGGLKEDSNEGLFALLDEVDVAYRGFAYEGAAMSLFLLDRLLPWRHRFRSFLEQAGGDHIYMAKVGAGWAMARLPFGLNGSLGKLDPLLRWLALDGYGFHQGYFHWPISVTGDQEVPRRVRGYGRRAFDQGLGRSLWFVDGADVERIPRTVASFSLERQPDLWAGLGLAAAYAGGVSQSHLEEFFRAASKYQSYVAQGAAFAVKARLRAGNPLPQTEIASQVLCGMSAEKAAEITDLALQDLPADSAKAPAYEVWRQRIQQRIQEERRVVGARNVEQSRAASA